MAFILGIKQGMSQIFKDEKIMPVTVILAGPCFVQSIKTKEKDGYQAVKLTFGERKKLKKPQEGEAKDLKIKPRFIKEFKVGEAENLKRGEMVKVESFKEGELVKVEGISIGKGFGGVVKRYGFHGAKATHGTKHDQRRSGSIGATAPQRVFKGKKMAGRMGGEKTTIRNLEILKIEPEKNFLYLKGAVPGKRGNLLKITSLK